MKHSARSNAFQSEQVWSLAPDALEVTSGPEAKRSNARYPYSDIASIRLHFSPTRFDRNRYTCTVVSKSGRSLSIASAHYASVAGFEDRGATYVPLATELVSRVAAANPGAQFRSGRRPVLYIGEQVFLAALVLLLLWALSLGRPSGFSILQIALLIAYVPLAAVYFQKNRPRRFEAGAIPPEVLPSIAGRG